MEGFPQLKTIIFVQPKAPVGEPLPLGNFNCIQLNINITVGNI